MDIPPLPTQQQLTQLMQPASSTLTKRNLTVALRLIQGESLRSVAQSYELTASRGTSIFAEVISLLRKKLFTEQERQGEFAHYLASKTADLRLPERQHWWSYVLQQLIPLAPQERDFLLNTKQINLPTYTKVHDHRMTRRVGKWS